MNRKWLWLNAPGAMLPYWVLAALGLSFLSSVFDLAQCWDVSLAASYTHRACRFYFYFVAVLP